MRKNKLKDYCVAVIVKVDATVNIKAESLESALDLAKDLACAEVVKVYGDVNDWSIELTGVFE